jgi:hypothetical protein
VSTRKFCFVLLSWRKTRPPRAFICPRRRSSFPSKNRAPHTSLPSVQTCCGKKEGGGITFVAVRTRGLAAALAGTARRPSGERRSGERRRPEMFMLATAVMLASESWETAASPHLASQRMSACAAMAAAVLWLAAARWSRMVEGSFRK